MVDRFPPAPPSVRATSTLLVCASGLGLVLTVFGLWARAAVLTGLGPLVDSLDRHDRDLFGHSWVLHAGRSLPLAANPGALIWLGLTYLVLLPLAYYVRRGFPPARTVTYLIGATLIGVNAFATIADDDFNDPGVDQLSPAAGRAWQNLFPPGYAGVHYALVVGLMAAVFLACLLLDRPASHAFFRRHAPRRRIIRAVNPHPRPNGEPT